MLPPTATRGGRSDKPDNIMIDPDGRMRVFDFGLARLAELLELP